jgi:Fanconi anemia group I protein
MLAPVKTRSSSVKSDGPNQHVANLGIDVLLRLFKYHDVVRSEILEQITSRIVSRSSSATDFLRLLGKIIKEYPDEVEKYLANVLKKPPLQNQTNKHVLIYFVL